MLPRVLLAVFAALLVLTGCGREEVPPPVPLASLSPTTTQHPEFKPDQEPAKAALGFVPSSAEVLTVTDFDEVRVQLGMPDLTSEDLMADRSEFWRRAEQEAVLLTDGMLREDNSTFWLDYDFTQDDVDWEAHFTGPEGNGFVLALRPDLELDGVRRAIADGVGPLAGAELIAEDHLVVSGVAEEGEQVWANEPVLDGLVGQSAASTYVRMGCIPVQEALGPDVTQEDLDQLQRTTPLSILDDLPAFVINYGDHVATIRVQEYRDDLFSRLDIGRDWPRSEFTQAFRQPVADPMTGRMGYTVVRPPLAAALTLLEELPFGVCNSVDPIAEPTGL